MRLRRLEPVLRAALSGPCRVDRGSTLLAAVSGGADSTAMLMALASIAPSRGIELFAAHLDHGLRGTESAGDRAFVVALCERLGVPLVSTRIDARARLLERGWSGEAGLRRLRRAFLLRAATRVNASAIATAHTADDQLETLLMRLARGTGLTGLGGMRPRHGVWCKPMLTISRAAVRRDLVAARIEWREDSSNATRAHLRNRVRLDVVPALIAALEPAGAAAARAKRGEALAIAAERAAGRIREARSALAREAAAALIRCRRPGGALALDAAALAAHPRAVQRLALARLWREAGTRDKLTDRHFSALLRLLCAGGPKSEVLLPQGYAARRARGTLTIACGITPNPRPAPSSTPSESLKPHD